MRNPRARSGPWLFGMGGSACMFFVSWLQGIVWQRFSWRCSRLVFRGTVPGGGAHESAFPGTMANPCFVARFQAAAHMAMEHCCCPCRAAHSAERSFTARRQCHKRGLLPAQSAARPAHPRRNGMAARQAWCPIAHNPHVCAHARPGTGGMEAAARVDCCGRPGRPRPVAAPRPRQDPPRPLTARAVSPSRRSKNSWV